MSKQQPEDEHHLPVTTGQTGIGRAVARGTVWTVAMRLSVRALSILSTLILARLLVPYDFGLVAKASLVYELIELATALGLQAALVSNQSAGRGHYDTVWTVHVLRGTALSLLLVVLAVPVAGVFNEPDLVYVLPAFALMTLIDGTVNVGVVDFLKRFRFDLDFRLTLYKRLTGFVVTIIVAYFWRSYWAFIAGMLAGSLVGLASSYLLSSYRPRFSLAEARSLFNFARFMLPAEILGALAHRIDGFILGRFESTVLFGIYSISSQIAALPTTELAMPVGRSLMPGLATLKDDPRSFRRLYGDSLAVVLAIALPIALGISAISDPLVLVLLGPVWAEAAPLLSALALAGVGMSIAALAMASLLSLGQARTYFYMRIVILVAHAIFLGTGYHVAGIIGLCWGLVLSVSVIVAVNLGVQSRIGMVDLGQLLYLVHRPVIGSIAMWLAVTGLGRQLSDSIDAPAKLAAGILVGAVTYLTVSLGLWLAEGRPAGAERMLLELIGGGCRPPRAPGCVR